MKKFFVLLIALLTASGASGQWFPQNSGITSNLNSVYFTDANTGYAVGNTGIILKTNDGGENWSIKNSGTSTDLRSVYFTDSIMGYTVGYGSLILKTIDGGENWISLSAGVSVNLNSVYFTAPDTGYVIGNFQSDSTFNYILKTTNGGTLWSISYLYKTEDDVGAPHLNSVYFPDANTGYAGGEQGGIPNYYPIILKTTNGGTDWTTQYAGNDGGVQSVYFINPDTGYIVGPLLKTTNGGTDWASLTLGIEVSLYAVCFTNAYDGYVVGKNQNDPPWGSIILNTSDGGINWTVQYLGNVAYSNLKSVYFANDTIGYSVGTGGAILKTNNGGFPVGINDKPLPTESLKIHPNPTSSTITISMLTPFHKNTILTFYDINGHQLIQRQITEQQTVLDVSGLPQGVYFVRVVDERTVMVGKFVKQ